MKIYNPFVLRKTVDTEELARSAAREAAWEAGQEAAREVAREALAEPAAQLLQLLEGPEVARREAAATTAASLAATKPASNVLAYNSNAWAMNDPRRFRDYADPRTRPYSAVSVDTLRMLARSYDVLAACITHLKSEVIKVPVKVVARDHRDTSEATRRAVEAANTFFGPRGGLGGTGVKRAEFEGRMLDDVLIIGAGALFLDYETIGAMRDGNPDNVIAIDASTIRPLISAYGFAPAAHEAAYEQVVQGQQVATFLGSELIYEGLPIFAQTNTPYFLSAVELLAMTIFTALKSDEWNRTWLTDGNVPDRLIKAPKEWTPDQIREYAQYFDDLLSGDLRARHKVRIVPEGTEMTEQTRKDADFQQFEWWLRDRTCSVMGVNPASIGHHSRQYQDSQSAAMDATVEGRVAQLREWRRSLYDDLLERKGWGFLQVVDDVAREEDARARAERHEIEIRSGLRTVNETRREDGLEPSREAGNGHSADRRGAGATFTGGASWGRAAGGFTRWTGWGAGEAG